MDTNSFNKWLRTAVPGSRFLYYVGNLMAERMTFNYTIGAQGQRELVEVWNPEINTVANAAWHAYATGKVLLCQIRVLPEIIDEATGQSRSRGVFGYYAQKVRQPGRLAREVRTVGIDRLGAENAYVES